MAKENIVILGSGPAGLTAAIYSARAGLEPLVLSGPEPGGQLVITTDVENYPGFESGVMGPDLVAIMERQASRFGARIEGRTATGIDLTGPPHRIETAEGSIETRALIIATGATARWLGLESEAKYRGKGVSACATCDGAFFRDKAVAVVGGGDSAMEEALFLTRFASSVTIIHRRDELRASRIMERRARENEGISFLLSTIVEEVLGDGMRVTGLKLKDKKTGESFEKPFDGLFVAIGHIPNTSLFEGILDLDESGYLRLPNPGRMSAGIEGVFAAGDVADSFYRQAVTAAGMGCMAAIEAERYLAEKE